MAPESERATRCADCGELPEHWRHKETLASRDAKDSIRHAFVEPHSPEPTLTCSEVVERLLNECVGGHDAWVDREKATAILHSWRERRVQELEELLREIFSDTRQGAIPNPGDPWFEKTEKALANSEWREQIRNGAKHE